MLVWFFTILDFFVILIVFLAQIGVYSHWRLFIVGAAYLILKGIAFKGEILSLIDLIGGVYLLIMALGATWFISWLLILWLAYKIFLVFFYR